MIVSFHDGGHGQYDLILAMAGNEQCFFEMSSARMASRSVYARGAMKRSAAVARYSTQGGVVADATLLDMEDVSVLHKAGKEVRS